MGSAFNYDPLLQDQIRLLQLTSCHPEIHCTIASISMSSNPRYTALSYTWGSDQNPQRLFVGDSTLAITENLANALHHLSDHIGKYLWVDAVCINQQDDTEKTEQVKRMAEIYRRADKVLSWLGVEIGGSNRAMEGIGRYGGAAFEAGILSLPAEVWKTWPDVGENSGFLEIKRRIFELFSAAAEADNNDSPEAFPRTEFADLTMRTYFGRLWIKQEVALGREVHMLCGKRATSFENLASAWMFFATFTLWEVTERQNGRLAGNPKHFAPELGRSGYEPRKTIKPNTAIGPLLSFRRKLHQENTRPTLLWLLKAFHVGDQGRSNGCKDVRDKIYGLLGMAEDGQDLVDYSRSVELLYEKVARRLFEGGFIDTLLFCPSRSSLKLPSWVPDWSKPIHHPWGSDGVYRASGERKQPRDIIASSTETGVIVLEGSRVGKAADVGTIWNALGSPSQFWFDLAGARKVFAEVKSFLECSAYTPQERIKATWRIPIGDRETDPDSRQWRRATQQSQDMYQRIAAAQSARLTGDDIADTQSYQSIMEATYNAKPFLLEVEGPGLESYVGLCPGETKLGDIVAIFFGASVPFVLRPGRDGYVVVGEAYVYGIMDGEFVQGGCKAETFRLESAAQEESL